MDDYDVTLELESKELNHLAAILHVYEKFVKSLQKKQNSTN